MKLFKLICFLLALNLTSFAQSGSDTAKYINSPDYGNKFKRVKVLRAFIPPTDTVVNKFGFAVLNGVSYIGNGTYWAASSGGGGGSMVYPGAGIPLSNGSAWLTSIADNSTNWNTAYTDRNKWDGSATGLVAATGRTSLGGSTIGQNMFTSTNPSAIRFGRANADNSFSWLDAAAFRTAIGVSTFGDGSGTTYSGGSVDLGGTLSTSFNLDLSNNVVAWIDGVNYPNGLFTVDGTTGGVMIGDMGGSGSGTHIDIQDGNTSINLHAPGEIYLNTPNTYATGHIGIPTQKYYYANNYPVLGFDATNFLRIGVQGDDINTFIHGFGNSVIQLTDGENIYTNGVHTFNGPTLIDATNSVTDHALNVKATGSSVAKFESVDDEAYVRIKGSNIAVLAIEDFNSARNGMIGFDGWFNVNGGGEDMLLNGTGGTVTVNSTSPLDSTFNVNGSLYGTGNVRFSGMAQRSLDTTNYKIGVFDGSGNLFKMYWPSGGGSMVYPGAGIAVSNGSAWTTSITDNSTNWNTAYTDRNKWDGGATGLVAATGRTSLGLVIGTDVLAPNGSAAALTGFPTFNQNTTGSAGSVANALSIGAEFIAGGASTYNGSAARTLALQNNSVTNAHTAQVATATFKGRTTAGTGNVEDMTATQATALLNVFGPSVKGLVPAAAGSPSSTKYLSEDGTFTTPAGGSATTTTDNLFDITANVLTAQKTPLALSDGATITWDASTGYNGRVTLGGNRTLDITNPQAGDFYTIVVVQDGTGFRGLTLPNGTAAQLNLKANDSTTISLHYRNTGWDIRSDAVAEPFIALTSTYTLTSTTASQKLFNVTTNGALTVEAATTYLFEATLYLTSMSGTSGNTKYDVLGAGTATVTSCSFSAIGVDNTSPGTAATSSGSFTVSTISSGNIVGAGTGTGVFARITGELRINAAGTIIPSVALTTAAAAVVQPGTNFRLWKKGSNTITNLGNWN